MEAKNKHPLAKRCTRCNRERPAADFCARADVRSGLMSHCRECQATKRADRSEDHKAYARDWYQANRDRVLAKERTRYRSDPAFAARKKRAAKAQRAKLTPGEWNAYWQDWRRRNPEKAKAVVHTRRARLLALPYENVDLRAIGEAHGWICHLCGGEITKMTGRAPESLAFDHIIPLARGGHHVATNIAPSHFRCNSRKKDSLHPLVFSLMLAATTAPSSGSKALAGISKNL